jgi:hypothetical protein
MTWRIIVFARQRGALGQFGLVELAVTATDREAARDAVFTQHSDKWEINHITAVWQGDDSAS